MEDRRVTGAGKDDDGDITSLCNHGDWGKVSKQTAIWQIENKTHKYYVGTVLARVDIHVVEGPNGKYLRTDPDATSKNNLESLPGC